MKNTKENKLSSIKFITDFLKIIKSNVYSSEFLTNEINSPVYIIWKFKNYVAILVWLKIDIYYLSCNSYFCLSASSTELWSSLLKRKYCDIFLETSLSNSRLWMYKDIIDCISLWSFPLSYRISRLFQKSQIWSVTESYNIQLLLLFWPRRKQQERYFKLRREKQFLGVFSDSKNIA